MNNFHILEKKIDREKLLTLAAFYQKSSAGSWLAMFGTLGKPWWQMSREHPLVPPGREEDIPPSFLQSLIWPEGLCFLFSRTVKFKVTDKTLFEEKIPAVLPWPVSCRITELWYGSDTFLGEIYVQMISSRVLAIDISLCALFSNMGKTSSVPICTT